MDFALYKLVNGLSGARAADVFFEDVSRWTASLLVVAVAVLFLVPWPALRTERRAGAVTATLAAAISLGLNQLISPLVDRARPYVAHPGHAHLLIAPSHDPSFPSDHTTGAFPIPLPGFPYDPAVGAARLGLAPPVPFPPV